MSGNEGVRNVAQCDYSDYARTLVCSSVDSHVMLPSTVLRSTFDRYNVRVPCASFVLWCLHGWVATRVCPLL